MASASGTVVPSSARALAVSISSSGCTTTAMRPAGTGRRTMSGGLGWRTRTKPAAQSAGAMLSGCAASGAQTLALDGAPDQRVERRVRVEERVDRHHRCRGAGRAAPESAGSGRPFAMQRATPRSRSPRAAQQRLRSNTGRVPRRLARQPSTVPGDAVDATPRRPPAGAKRAVTSSPGASSGNPSTSNPHATLETVAGRETSVTPLVDRRLRAPGPCDTGGGWWAPGTRGTLARNRTSD